jgi:polyisoprenyl-teichoic acid--peptidoglycan teichoic acid transferase
VPARLIPSALVTPTQEGSAATVTPRWRNRHLPAFLDAIFPGLGHLVAGRRARAALFAIPVMVLLVLAVIVLAFTPTIRLIAMALDPAVLAAFFAIQALLLIWRLLAVASSLFDPTLPRIGRADALPIVLIVLVIVAPQAYAGIATNVAREATDAIVPFDPETTGAWAPPAAGDRGDSGAFDLPSPSVSPSASPSPTAVPRQNILLIGVDQGVGRNTFLTDTMIVVSLDPVAETVSMISIPRDMVDVPLPDGRRFRGKINGLLSYARHHPNNFPGSDGTGHDVLMGALGTLLDVRIDHFAQVNLGGFVRVIDTLGGIDVDVDDGFCDPTYDEYGFSRGFAISPGRHHLNGQQALAFARIRKAAGESDFTRAARQQEVLSGVRDAIKGGGFLRDPIGLMQALSKTVVTNVPRDVVPGLADVASRVGRGQTYRAVITHPLVRSGYDSRGSIQLPDVEGIRELAASLYTTSGVAPPEKYRVAESSGRASGSGVSSCGPAATPKPKPATTPAPTSRLTPSASPSQSATPSPTASPTPKPTARPTKSPPPTPPPTPAPTPTPTPTPAASDGAEPSPT